MKLVGKSTVTMWFTRILVFVFFYLCAAAIAEKGLYAYREKLCNSLSSTYQKDLYPDGPDGGPVEVHHSIYLQALLGLADDTLSLHFWENMNWNDPRLQWDPELFGGVTRIRLPSKSVWQPDIILTNSVKQYSGFVTGDLNVIVYFDGNVTFVPPKTTKSGCHFNEASLYSNNQVNCTLRFMSWAHSKNSIDILPTANKVVIDHHLSPNHHWQITGGEVTKKELPFEDEVYPFLEYNLHIKRVG